MKGDVTQPALFMTVRRPPPYPPPYYGKGHDVPRFATRVRIRNSAWRANIFELLIGERESALLAHMEIVGGIHGKRTMQRLWHKHAWHTGHDVAGGIVGRYDARAIKRPTARAISGWCPRYELNVRQTV